MKGKEYTRPMGANWWLQKRPYTLFILRELTAVFVAGYALFLIVLVYRASQGPDVFNRFVEGLTSPVSIALHLITLAMALYHSITWWSAMPKAAVFWRGDERVAPGTIIAAATVIWILVSVLVAGIAVAAAH